MCIAIYAPAKAEAISAATLRTCARQNPDGQGLMWAEHGRIQMYHTMKDVDKLHEVYRSAHDRGFDVVLHFRWATHGRVGLENTHPFFVPDTNQQLAFVHNGILSCPSTEEVSDTRMYGIHFLSYLKDGWLDNPITRSLVDDTIGSSKLILLTAAGKVTILGEKRGEWSNGVWYSNSGYKGYRTDLGWSRGSKGRSSGYYGWTDEYDAWETSTAKTGYSVTDKRSASGYTGNVDSDKSYSAYAKDTTTATGEGAEQPRRGVRGNVYLPESAEAGTASSASSGAGSAGSRHADREWWERQVGEGSGEGAAGTAGVGTAVSPAAARSGSVEPVKPYEILVDGRRYKVYTERSGAKVYVPIGHTVPVASTATPEAAEAAGALQKLDREDTLAWLLDDSTVVCWDCAQEHRGGNLQPMMAVMIDKAQVCDLCGICFDEVYEDAMAHLHDQFPDAIEALTAAPYADYDEDDVFDETVSVGSRDDLLDDVDTAPEGMAVLPEEEDEFTEDHRNFGTPDAWGASYEDDERAGLALDAEALDAEADDAEADDAEFDAAFSSGTHTGVKQGSLHAATEAEWLQQARDEDRATRERLAHWEAARAREQEQRDEAEYEAYATARRYVELEEQRKREQQERAERTAQLAAEVPAPTHREVRAQLIEHVQAQMAENPDMAELGAKLLREIMEMNETQVRALETAQVLLTAPLYSE